MNIVPHTTSCSSLQVSDSIIQGMLLTILDRMFFSESD